MEGKTYPSRFGQTLFSIGEKMARCDLCKLEEPELKPLPQYNLVVCYLCWLLKDDMPYGIGQFDND